MLHKRLSLALSLLVISGCAIVATRYISGQTNQQRKTIRMTVMRGKDHLKDKPTRQEIVSFRAAQENEKQERTVEDKLPKHLPIKIKIKAEKEKAFKDLNNDRWIRDLEIEVKNTGNKPIYYLVVLVDLPELRVGESNLLFDLRFGDKKFMNFAADAKPEDLSLKPGETYVFKIEAGNELDWENFRRGKDWPKPKRFELLFQELSFGDGTGFRSTDGAPWPTPGKQAGLGALPASS